jgi:nicotinamide-nucleotide amidase
MKNVEKLIKILRERNLSISCAESVSGGYLAYLLTKIPGSSQVFKGGLILYSLEAKHKIFKIPLALLKKTQGVSKEVAILLAKKVRALLKTDIGVSIVGFAGPQTKKGIKVGGVFMAVADKNGTVVKKITIKGKRDRVRKVASLALIDFLYSRYCKVFHLLF